jgi:hypothetical protein
MSLFQKNNTIFSYMLTLISTLSHASSSQNLTCVARYNFTHKLIKKLFLIALVISVNNTNIILMIFRF